MQCSQAARGRGDNTQARVPGGRPVTAGRPSLSSALSPDTARGKKSCFEVKLLEHHLRDLTSVWRHQGTRDEKPGQRLGALASQPAACTQEAPNSGALQTEGSPAASCSPADRRPVQRRGAGSRGWRPLYLSNASQLLNIVAGVVFFFFSILFKLKLSKVEPDKSEGCRGSGLSFLRLMTSAKDNTQLWVKCQQGQRSHQG